MSAYVSLPNSKNQTILLLALSVIALISTIKFSLDFFENKVILKLSIDAFEYRASKIRWEDITRIYLKNESVENGINHSLIIEVANGSKDSFSLDGLDQDYAKILYEIGKFYGNYKTTETTSKNDIH